jgi:hypothetical protein
VDNSLQSIRYGKLLDIQRIDKPPVIKFFHPDISEKLPRAAFSNVLFNTFQQTGKTIDWM